MMLRLKTKVMHIWKYNAFTLMKHFKGSGRGQLFINLAIDQAIKFGKSKIWLGVWEHNPKALSFYKTEDLELQGRINFILEV